MVRGRERSEECAPKKKMTFSQMDTSPEVHCRQVRPKNHENAASHLRTYDFGCVVGAMPALQVAEKFQKCHSKGAVCPRNLLFSLDWRKSRSLASLGMTLNYFFPQPL
jgi:hypothetical protein